MNTQIIKVYYGSDALPYKDKERTIHFPISGSTFLGSSDTTKIRFYVDGYLADENALWISVSKRADGQQGSQFLTSGTDEDGDKYREMTLSGWYTEKKGDLYISLKGYQGGSTGYWDEETGMYVVQGVPVIRATGSIKLAINYAPVGEYPYYQDEIASFQDLVAQLGNKLNITSGIVVVSDISVASVVLYTEGQLIYDKATKSLYVVSNGAFVSFFETYDKDILDTKFSGKVDKLSTNGKYAYTHEGSTQGETQVSEDVVNGAITSRTNSGQLKVPTTPTNNSHATSKGYVDSSISSERTYLLGVINDAGHSLGLVESTDPSKEYDYIIQLKDKAGNVISAVELDLPLEQIITDGSYDSTTKEIVLTLDNGSEVRIPVGDLVEGLVDEQGLETALAPYIKEINVSSVLSTNDLLEQVGVDKYFILDNIGSPCLCYISEDNGTYTLNVISKENAYHNSFTENTLVRNLLGDGTLDIDYLPIITLSQAMQTLTLGEIEIANQDNSIIKYNGRIYHKANETESAIEYVSADYDIANGSTNTVITKYEISVNKSTRATTMLSQNLNVYSIGEMDALLNRKANTRGDYPLLIVGKSLVAEQIENINEEVGSTQTNPFTFQATGTNDNTTETPTAPVAKHLELRGNSVVWNQLVGSETISLTLTSGHKYLTKIGGVESIITSSGETISVTGGTDQVFDLTLLGKEYDSVLSFNRDYPKPYYEYNAGELKSCSSSKLVTIGCNQLSELNTFIKVIAGQTYELSGVSVGGYIEEYDFEKNLIKTSSEITSTTQITLTNNTHYVKVQATTYSNAMFRLYWNETHEYVPFVKHEYDLPSVELKSDREVFDKLTPNGTLTRNVVEVDLDSVEWYYDNILSCWQSNLFPSFVADNAVAFNVLSEKYTPIRFNAIAGSEVNSIAFRDNGYIYVNNGSNSVQPSGKAIYKLAISTTEQVTLFAENIEVDDFGTMEFVPSDSTEEVIVPQGNKFFYPADYVLFLDDLYNRSKDGGETSGANNFVVKSELKEAISQIPAGDFGFSLIQAPSSNILTDEQIAQIRNKGTIIVGNISGWGNWQKYILFPYGEEYSGRYFGYCILTRNGFSHIEQYSINLTDKTIMSYGNKYIDIDSATNITINGLNSVNGINIGHFYKKPQSSVSLSDGGTITDNTLKTLIQNEQPIKLNGFTCYFSCDDGTNYQYVNTRYDSNANVNHINVITINKSTWVATFHTSDIALN